MNKILKKRVMESQEVVSLSSTSSHSTNQTKKPRLLGEDLELNSFETTVQGQLKLNPHFTVKQAEIAAKKEYNRRNSARSRVRKNQMVNHLEEECTRLASREKQLMRENDILKQRLQAYERKEEESKKLASVVTTKTTTVRPPAFRQQKPSLIPQDESLPSSSCHDIAVQRLLQRSRMALPGTPMAELVAMCVAKSRHDSFKNQLLANLLGGNSIHSAQSFCSAGSNETFDNY